MNRKKIILYIGHTFDLAFFTRLMPLINPDNEYNITAIVAKGKYFKEMHHLDDILMNFSDTQILVKEGEIPGYSKNILKALWNSIKLRLRIRNLDKGKNILISIDKSTFMANFLNSRFRNVLLIQTIESSDKELHKHFKLRVWRTIWFNLINLLTCSKFVIIYCNKGSKRKVHQFRIINSNAKIVYRNKTNLINRISLPAVASEFSKNKVVIFGSRFNEWEYFKENSAYNRIVIFKFYKYISELFIDFDIYYKPHPKETGREYDEINSIFNDRLINVGNVLNSELYLLKNPDIAYCFSINSTSSISAYEMGFNSKVFYKLLKFPYDLLHDMNKTFQDASDDFFISEINKDIENKILKKKEKKEIDYISDIINSL